eukprot:Lankesteria_metandrocarpae@DN9088_c0_g1_i1.p1
MCAVYVHRCSTKGGKKERSSDSERYTVEQLGNQSLAYNTGIQPLRISGFQLETPVKNLDYKRRPPRKHARRAETEAVDPAVLDEAIRKIKGRKEQQRRLEQLCKSALVNGRVCVIII